MKRRRYTLSSIFTMQFLSFNVILAYYLPKICSFENNQANTDLLLKGTSVCKKINWLYSYLFYHRSVGSSLKDWRIIVGIADDKYEITPRLSLRKM